MNYIITFLKGIIVGVCNVIPGVSGGTLVVVFNIYDQFMDIASLNIKKIIQNRKFTIPFLIGMLSGILLFSKLITILFANFPTQTYYFFTGLIIGSIPLLFSYSFCNKEEKLKASKTISLIFGALIGIAIIVAFTILQNNFNQVELISGQELPAFSMGLALRIFIAGVLGAVAMIIPGISGSLLMLIMGVYPILIAAIPALVVPSTFFRALVLLLPNGIGVLVGLIAGSNLLKFLLKKFPNHTYAVIFGLILGSIYAIFPGFKGLTSVSVGIASFICLIAGASLAYFSTILDKKLNQENEKGVQPQESQTPDTEIRIE
ncbi:MAG: DUF368 domain-containing protein [Treponema sp.]|nr:DUF368 domain-containing protein [Treponema sp.]